MIAIKRIYAFAAALCLFACSAPGALAESETSGTLGDLTWEYSADEKTLTIGGTECKYQNYNTPWDEFKTEIETVRIEDSVTKLGSNFFADCAALTTVEIGSGLKVISEYAFRNMNEDYISKYTLPPIQNITVSEENENYCSVENVLFNKDKTELVMYPFGSTESEYVLPETVVKIRKKAFAGSLVQSVVLNDGLSEIGERAFYKCSALSNVTIPDTVNELGKMAFSETAYLSNENNRTDGIIYSGNWALNISKDLENVNVKPGTVGIAPDCWGSKYILGGTAAKTFSIPKSMRRLNVTIFGDCKKLTSINADAENEFYTSRDGVLYSKDMSEIIRMPRAAEFTSFDVPDTVDTIGANAMADCNNLVSVVLPETVKAIGYSAFSSCDNLERVELNEGLEDIGGYAFYYCDKLDSVEIPKTVTHIGDWAFNYTAMFENDENWQDGLLFYIDDCLVFSRKSDELTKLEIKPGTRLMAESVLSYNFENVTELVIPESLLYIGEYAANGLTKLERVLCYKTPEQWAEVSIGEGNQSLTDAQIVYMPFTKSEAVQTDNGCTIGISARNVEIGKRIIAAGYAGDRLIDVKLFDYDGADRNITLGKGIDRVKVYVWDDALAPYAKKPESIAF